MIATIRSTRASKSSNLAEYRRKRRFDRTPEPAGKVKRPRAERLFVIQKHAASRLHYDFRLEWNGTLKSWAVPNGPSLDPKERRLAVEVEDHPVEYGDFEGVIPEGQYGGGTVMLWDRGTWEPLGDADAGLRAGKLKFMLHGQRLHGEWSLVRMSGRGETKPQWLLIKGRDEHARSGEEGDVTGENTTSVVSDRAMEEIAAARERTWQSHRNGSASARRNGRSSGKRTNERVARASRRRKGVALGVANLAGAVKAALPKRLAPQLPLLVSSVPVGDQWLHEVKLDGYRLMCFLDSGRVRLMTRGEQDWTARFPAVAEALQAIPIDGTIIDGEIIARASDGSSTFQNLQNALRHHAQLELHVFDLPFANGFDLTQIPLIERKDVLRRLLERTLGQRHPIIRFSEHAQGQGHELWQAACNHALEGLVSKQAQSKYVSGRSGLWMKTKCLLRQEFVIVGYTDPERSRTGFGALLLGYHEDDELRYAGRVGAGFSTDELKRLHRKLVGLDARQSSFATGMTSAECRGAHWTRPTLVAEIEFSQWTRDGRLRTPVYLGLREDKTPREIGRERPVSVAIAATATSKVSRMTKANSTSPKPRPAKASRGDATTAVSITRSAAKGNRIDVADVSISNPDRVVFPELEFTKGDLAKYYKDIADQMLPYVSDRPLTLVRCPSGSSGQCFYQKHFVGDLPEHLEGVTIHERRTSGRYLLVRDASGLVALAQMGVLEIHTWGCRTDDIERPDRLVFDLDPGPDVSWESVADAARDTRQVLHAAGLESFVQTSGGKGLHVVVPLKPQATWDQAKNFAKTIAVLMEQREPAKYVSVMTKAKRSGRIFVDYLRNGRGATSISPYSTRAKPNGAVATPISWNELGKVKGADAFDALTLPRRLSRSRTDPWKGYFNLKQGLPKQALV